MKNIFYVFVVLATTIPTLTNAATYYWIVGSGNWTSGSNWSTSGFSGIAAGTTPGSGDSVCMGNGSNSATVTLTGSVTIGILTLEGSGQIFINGSGYTLTVNTDVYDINSSTTGGGTATIAIGGSGTQHIYGNSSLEDVGKLPNLNIDCSGTVYLYGDITMGGSTTLTYTSGTVNAGSSDVIFYYANTINGNFTLSNALNHVEFQGNGGNHAIDDTITVAGTLTISGSSSGNLNTGYIKAEGNITITNTFSFNGNPTGSATIIVCGSGTQTLTGSGTVGEGCLCNLTVNKSSGTFYLSSVITTGENWKISAGTVDATSNSSTLAFYYTATITGSMTFYNLEFYAIDNNYTYTIASGTTLTSTNDLKFGPTYYLRLVGGTIDMQGNITVTNASTTYASPSSTALVIDGTGNQYIIGNNVINGGELPGININKPSGILYLEDTISVMGTWRYTQGELNTSAYANLVAFTYDDSIVGSDTLSNIEFDPFGNNCTYTFSSGSTLTVTNNITFGSTNGILLYGGTINAEGNMYIPNTKTGTDPGSTSLIINGTGSQAIYGNGVIDDCKLPNVTINKSSGTLYLDDTVSIGGNLTYTAGSVDVTTNPNLLVFSYSNTIAGSLTLNGVMFYADLGNMSYSIASGATLTTGNLYVKNTSTNTNTLGGSGSLVVNGNINNSSTLTISCNNLTMSGSSNQNLPGTTMATISNLTVNNSSGLTLNNSLSISGTLYFTSGVISSTSTNMLKFNSGSTVSGVSNSSYVSGPVSKTGTTSFIFPIGGTISSTPTYVPLAISAPSSSDTWTASYVHSGSLASRSLGTGVTYVDPCEYWTLSKSGSSSVKVTLNWNSPCFHIASMSYVIAANVSSGAWDSTNATSTSGDTTAGSLTSSLHSSWDTITIAKTNPLVTANAGSATAICNGSSISIGGSPTGSGGTGTLTYAWSPSTGLSSTTATNPTASPTVTTTYTVTVTDAITELSSATVVVTVNPLPSDNAGSNTAICNGSSTSIGASSIGGHTYSWTPSTGLSSTTVSNPTASPTTTTTYTLTETITVTGCSTSNNVAVTVNPVPGNNAGINTVICIGSSVALGTGDSTTDSYNWSPSTGLSSTTVSNPSASPTITTTYTLTETNSSTGCSVSNEVTVIVNTNLTVNAGRDTTICQGNSVTIGLSESVSGGTMPYIYSWSPSIGLDSINISERTATPENSTTYTLFVVDSNGCNGISNIIVSVDVIVPHTGGSKSICSGSSIDLGTTLTMTGGVPPYSYSWTPSTGLSATDVSNPSLSSIDSLTYYYLSVGDSIGCLGMDSLAIYIFSLPNVNAGRDSSGCLGTIIKLGGNPTATGDSPYIFEWRDGYHNLVSDSSNPLINIETQYYYLKVTDANNCISTDSVAFTLTTYGLLVNAGRDTTISLGSPVLLGGSPTASGGSPPYSYYWWPQQNILQDSFPNPIAMPTSNINYVLAVTDSLGCLGKDTIDISLIPAPTINIASNVINICNGDTATLGDSVLISGGYPPYTYYWQPNIFINDTTATLPKVYPSYNISYTLNVTDSLGYHYASTVYVIVSKPIVFAGWNKNILPGCSVLLGGSPTAVSGDFPFTFLWNPGVTDSTNPNPIVQPTADTHYWIKMTDQMGCIGYDTTHIKMAQHADSLSNPIMLHDPDSLNRYYSLTTTDSVVWFKFHSDSTHVLIVCGEPSPDTVFLFSTISLFVGSIDSLTLITEDTLNNLPFKQANGLQIDSSLSAGVDYYIRIQKTSGEGNLQSPLLIMYTAALYKPYITFNQ